MTIYTLSLEDLQDEDNDSGEDTQVKENDTSDDYGVEREYTLYFRTIDFKQFSKADACEVHDQSMIKIPKSEENASSGGIRARMTTYPNGEHKYTLTVKNVKGDGFVETETRISKSAYTQIVFLANARMLKHRYIFNIPNTDLKWEIDIYPDGNGGWYPWGRAELEVEKPLDTLPKLPIEVEELISVEDQQDETGKAKVKALFDNYFLRKNPYLVKLGAIKETEPEQGEQES